MHVPRWDHTLDRREIRSRLVAMECFQRLAFPVLLDREASQLPGSTQPSPLCIVINRIRCFISDYGPKVAIGEHHPTQLQVATASSIRQTVPPAANDPQYRPSLCNQLVSVQVTTTLTFLVTTGSTLSLLPTAFFPPRV